METYKLIRNLILLSSNVVRSRLGLHLDSSSVLHGSDMIGDFTAYQFKWTANLTINKSLTSTKSKLFFITTIIAYVDGHTIAFNQSFPNGVNGTSLPASRGTVDTAPSRLSFCIGVTGRVRSA